MSLLAQSGYGRAQKIQEGLRKEVIRGAVLSPRDEKRERLESFVNELARDFPNALVLFDPQFYASTLLSPNDGHLPEYDYYADNCGLTRTHFSAARIRGYVESCLAYQNSTFGRRLSFLVSPSVLLDDFRDNWSQVALELALEAKEYHSDIPGAPPLLISVVFSEAALSSLEALEEYLDALTELDVAGFYLIVKRNSSAIVNSLESSLLAHLMFTAYVLAEMNSYRVIFGYTDWYGFLLESVGAHFTASGWYQNLRQFSLSRFMASSGGRRPRKRYSSTPLLSCPLIFPELEDVFQADQLAEVLSGSNYDAIISNGPAGGESNWTEEVSCLHHWATLSSISRQVFEKASIKARLDESARLIQNAQSLYSGLQRRGIDFELPTGPYHLEQWLAAMREFRLLVGA
jgi:hypothetical protein